MSLQEAGAGIQWWTMSGNGSAVNQGQDNMWKPTNATERGETYDASRLVTEA